MENPVCKKCGGALEHSIENTWICVKCGETHICLESKPNGEAAKLKDISAEVQIRTEQAKDRLQYLIAIIEEFRWRIQKFNLNGYDAYSDIPYILENHVQNIYKLLHESDEIAEFLVKTTDDMTRSYDSHFELLADILSQII